MKWQPIETAPKHQGGIMMWGLAKYWSGDDPYLGVWVGGYHPEDDSWKAFAHDDLGFVIDVTPSHWMPLPDPPVETDEDAAP